jgi:hypothetical protein
MVLSRTGLISRVTTLLLIRITADDSLSTDILLSGNGNSRQHLLQFSAAALRPSSSVRALFRFTSSGTLLECREQTTLLFKALKSVYDSEEENQLLFSHSLTEHYNEPMSKKEYTKEERTAQICQLIRKMGYPEEFGYALAEELETENAMRRMVGYLLSADHPRMEDIADEALAIIEMNQHWKEKKIREYEHARYLNENRRR